jgi:hypothetical protein
MAIDMRPLNAAIRRRTAFYLRELPHHQPVGWRKNRSRALLGD